MKEINKMIKTCVLLGIGIFVLTGCSGNRNIDVVHETPMSINQQISQLIEKGKYKDAASLFPSQMDHDLKELYYINNALLCDQSFDSSCVASFLIDLMEYNGTLKPKVDELMDKYHSHMVDISNNRRLQGVSDNKDPYIGMSEQDLLDFGWGRPDDINKTITKYGTDEQWVYKHKGNVYLTDGKITSIQTNN